METGIQLRDYQAEFIECIRVAMRNKHTRIIGQLGTGGGKTYCFTYIAKVASEVNKKNVLVLSNRKKLHKQAYQAFSDFNVDYDVIDSKTKKLPTNKVNVALIGTMKSRCAKRLDFQMFVSRQDIVIIDECDQGDFFGIFKYFDSKTIVIGVTATPISANSKKPLSDYYQVIVQGKSIEWMIDKGHLCEPNYYEPCKIDFSGVKMKGGDFDPSELEKIYSEKQVFEGLKESKEKHWGNRKTLVFCPNVTVSKQVAEELGFLHIDGYMSDSEQSEVLTKFHTDISEYGLCTSDLLVAGYDFPPIENIVFYIATDSLRKYLQICGRGSRPCDGEDKYFGLHKKAFYIFDFGGNVKRHGYWHSERTWTLEKKKKRTKKDRLEMYPIKDCPECGCLMPAQSKKCPNPECGYVYHVNEKEKLRAELEMMSYAEIKAKVKEVNSLKELEEIRIAKDYKQGWLLRQLTCVADFEEYARFKGYKSGWVKRQVEFYEKNLVG